jgi:D-serine deaminase-like pyridoxal phosphate-dependent protein
MFMDLFQAGLGVCSLDDIALAVLTTVIGRKDGDVIVDAGALALSLDRSTAGTSFDAGYGLVADLDGAVLDGHRVARVTQEHGIVHRADGGRVELTVGDRVRILPNHACMTAAAHEAYEVVDGDLAVDRWPRVNGW